MALGGSDGEGERPGGMGRGRELGHAGRGLRGEGEQAGGVVLVGECVRPDGGGGGGARRPLAG